MHPVSWKCVAVVLCVAILPASASAQGIAKTLDELRLLTRPGDTVTVADGSGTEVSGRITTMSPASLVVQVNGATREWKESEIVTIRQRRGDSLANGAWWGLGIGAGLIGIAIAVEGVEDGDAGYAAGAVAVYGGLGAAVGVGIDALITRKYVIFERPATSARWHVAPIVSRQSQGARVTFRF
jgi:hypothetical protein